MIEARSEPTPWQCTVTNGDADVLADTTAEKGGSGTGIRPHELLESSLASCLNMTVRMVAERDEVPVESVTVTVVLDRDADRANFRYAIDVDGVDAETESALQDAVETCSVHETLTTDLQFELVADATERSG